MHEFLDAYYTGESMPITLIAQNVGRKGTNRLDEHTHEDFTPFPLNPTTKMDVLISHHVTITTMACREQKHGWASVPCCG
jgi:hypothetical protein